MAFFSFSLLEDSFCFVSEHLEANLTYYSKDITLWKELNNKKKKIQLNSIKYEKRVKIDTLGKKLLICLPPKFGLGDAIEYSVAINSINKSKKFSKVGIAFCSNHTFVFKTIFSFHNIYPVCISSNEISKYDEKGAGWYWNNFETGEHTGTHLASPNHWVTGKDKYSVDQIPVEMLIGSGCLIDMEKEVVGNE